jgi:hypothetical protein
MNPNPLSTRNVRIVPVIVASYSLTAVPVHATANDSLGR